MDDAIASYSSVLGLTGATFKRVDRVDSLVAVVYEVCRPGAAPLILKICPRLGDYHRELYFLRMFAQELPVPAVVGSVPPSDELAGAVLMTRLPGASLQAAAMTDAIAYELGSLLARIHLHRTARYGDLTTPTGLHEMALVPLRSKIEEALAECEGHLSPAIVARCRHRLEQSAVRLERVDGPCIIHRDFRPSNIVVHAGRVQGIIDWASARAGFAEEDFAAMQHDVWEHYPQSRDSFLAGYISIRPAPAYEDVMPLLCMQRALAIVGMTVREGTWQGPDAYLYAKEKAFLEKLG